MSRLGSEIEPDVLPYGPGGYILFRSIADLLTSYAAYAIDVSPTGEVSVLIDNEDDPGTSIWVDITEVKLSAPSTKN